MPLNCLVCPWLACWDSLWFPWGLPLRYSLCFIAAPCQFSSKASFPLHQPWMLVFPRFLWVAFSVSILPGWSHLLLQPEIHGDSQIFTLDLSWAMNQYVQLPFELLHLVMSGISRAMCLEPSYQFNSKNYHPFHISSQKHKSCLSFILLSHPYLYSSPVIFISCISVVYPLLLSLSPPKCAILHCHSYRYHTQDGCWMTATIS